MNDPGGPEEDGDWYTNDWRWRTEEEEELFFWGKPFVPPPPRPPYWEDTESLVLTDGLTTCDLCSWALDPPPATLIDEWLTSIVNPETETDLVYFHQKSPHNGTL
ncbi:hypothetical protein M8J75_013464 [Diaphorina citri]|nr:hypothetical protein M8J75_013464 [Diaphorina citri]